MNTAATRAALAVLRYWTGQVQGQPPAFESLDVK